MRKIIASNVGGKSSYSLLNARVNYRYAFGPIDVTAFLDLINVTAASSDDIGFDYCRAVEVKDDNEADPLFDLRLDDA